MNSEIENVSRRNTPFVPESASDPDGSKLNKPEHLVQFYETEEFLLDTVSGFVGTGLGMGAACIVISTPEHREGLEQRLRTNAFDPVAAQSLEKYFPLDAAATLAQFMENGSLQPERFTQVIGALLERAAKGGRRLRIFGEMVALLWEQGNQVEALHLEGLWNKLHQTLPYPFSLLCAYSMPAFAGEQYGKQFSEICQQHTRVIPGESYTLVSDSSERLRIISLLQQKAHSLEVEIAERKATERHLQLSEQRYRNLFEASHRLAAIVESSDDAILSKDLDGIITSWNAAAERIYGYTAQEIIGQPVTILFPPNQYHEFSDIMARIHRAESINHYETLRVRKDGTYLTVSVTISPVKNEYGTIIGASAIARDMTERKQLEAKYKQLFDSNLVGVFISDFPGTFLDANDAFLDLIGYTREELQDGTIQRDIITPPEHHVLSQQAIKAMQEGGTSGTYEKEYIRKDGRTIPVLVAVTRISHTDTCIGLALDISARKELEKRKDEFIGIASHELKTPVTSLKGFLNLLQRSLAKQGKEKELHYLARMDTQVNKLTKLINDLLDLSRMQTSQLAYREEHFDFDALVQEIVENIQGTTQTHRIQLEGLTQTTIFGDRDRIGQVLINLLNNAIKYSPQADTVLVRVAKGYKNIRVDVQDFGMGIAKEHQHTIFERFYQITDAEGKAYTGLGIGLYISSEIVKRHHGQLWVDSQKGKGSTFHFTLPLT